MIDPLKIWKTDKVTQLLLDFYQANFAKAGIDINLAESIVNVAWEKKLKMPEAELMQEINKFFTEAKVQAHTGITETSALAHTNFSNTKTFLDYGANKFRILNEIGHQYPHIDKLIGVDVIDKQVDFAYPSRSEYIKIKPNAADLHIAAGSVDTINVQFVLHHIEDAVIEKILKELANALSPKGQLILWEETFEHSIDLKNLVEENTSLGFQTDSAFSDRFYNLSEEERWEFIIANDWLINVNNLHMQWTGTYKPWKEWEGMLNKNGLSLKQKFNLGLRLNGIIKQGVHMVGIFERIE